MLCHPAPPQAVKVGEVLVDDVLCIGCAGGVDVTAERSYEEVTPESGSIGYRIVVKGLEGGHSGMDIYKGLGNANKIMNRLLIDAYEHFGLQVSEITGGRRTTLKKL